MNGGIAVLYQGKQVGGMYDWKIDITPNSILRDGWREFKVTKEITAHSYWLTDTPSDNCFEVKFYKVVRGQLALMDSGMIEIDLHDKTVGRLIYTPLEIRWVK